jgi:hypothetical protein
VTLAAGVVVESYDPLRLLAGETRTKENRSAGWRACWFRSQSDRDYWKIANIAFTENQAKIFLYAASSHVMDSLVAPPPLHSRRVRMATIMQRIDQLSPRLLQPEDVAIMQPQKEKLCLKGSCVFLTYSFVYPTAVHRST